MIVAPPAHPAARRPPPDTGGDAAQTLQLTRPRERERGSIECGHPIPSESASLISARYLRLPLILDG